LVAFFPWSPFLFQSPAQKTQPSSRKNNKQPNKKGKEDLRAQSFEKKLVRKKIFRPDWPPSP
jgi:hypothetical protein